MVYENKQDWPEKYDINKLVSRQDDIDKIINGKKHLKGEMIGMLILEIRSC